MCQLDYFSKIKNQYPHLDDEVIDDLEGKAKEILISLLYPNIFIVSEEKKQMAYNAKPYWILRCMQDMISRLGMESVLSYKENGLSITFSKEQLSDSLKSEITPIMRMIN